MENGIKSSMKLHYVLLIQLMVSCCVADDTKFDKETKVLKADSSMPAPAANELIASDTAKGKLSGKKIKITVSYAAISCGCPQWFETKFENVPFLDRVERFYLEPMNSSLPDANSLWDGEHLPLTLTVTGRFSEGRYLPPGLGDKDEPEKARIFWYEKIQRVFPSIR